MYIYNTKDSVQPVAEMTVKVDKVNDDNGIIVIKKENTVNINLKTEENSYIIDCNIQQDNETFPEPDSTPEESEEENSETTIPDTLPTTGDTMPLGMVILVFALSITGLGLVFFKKKKSLKISE